MRKKRTIPAALIVLFLAVVLFATGRPEGRAREFFESNYELLQEDVKRYSLDNPTGECAGAEVQYFDGEYPIVQYSMGSGGLFSGVQYAGVFYSADDVPVSFQNSGEELIAISENEWEWNGAGDNHGLVRRLELNWFYYEASF